MSGLFNKASLVLVPSGYKAGKVYSQVPTSGDGDLTFTRASDATRVNSDGLIEVVGSGVPRLDYSQGSCPALLLEPQRTNLFLHSENTTNWTFKAKISTTTNTTTAPDGTLSADTITEDTTNGLHYIGLSGLGSASTFSCSVFAKPNGRDFIYLTLFDGSADRGAYFNISNGTIGNIDSGVTAKIKSASNGFYRCEITATTVNSFSAIVRLATANGTRVYLGDGVSGAFVWGMQLEEGAYATSYIKTTSATVTRLADGQKVENIASLIGQTEGTIFMDIYFQELSQAGFRLFFCLEGTVANQFSAFSVATSNSGNNINYAGVNYSLTTGRHKIVCTYSEANNERKLYVDGALRSTSTHSNFLATISQLSIGCRINPFSSFTTDRPLDTGSGINAFAMYPTLLSDDDCLTLSTL